MHHIPPAIASLLLLLSASCSCSPAPAPGDGGQGGRDGGEASDGGDDESDGGSVDQGEWTWLPVEGSRCAMGATAGIGVNLSDASDDVFIFLQGGGACWNQGSCLPSLLSFGPVCYYNPNVCLYDGPGGTQPLASHVRHPDPFPADGSGVFESELALISGVRLFDRSDEANPFRAATFVYVPYCTGDLHGGDAVATYAVKHDAFGAEQQVTFHFAGASNMQRYLDEIAALRPAPDRVWLTGASAGGYGATLNFERVIARFPDADVALLADSAPFVDTELHWQTWRDAWNLQLPEGCAACSQGFSDVMRHLVATHADERRIALLAFDADAVIRYFFHGATGPDPALNPPAQPYADELDELLAIFDDSDDAHYFVLPGSEHVMLQGVGTRLEDGGYSDPRPGPEGAPNLKEWVDAWGTASSVWRSAR